MTRRYHRPRTGCNSMPASASMTRGQSFHISPSLASAISMRRRTLKPAPAASTVTTSSIPTLSIPRSARAADHAALIAASQAAGLGHLLDFVPNHMGIGVQNPWWQDVLEWGEGSPYAGYFDINWRPVRADMRDKLLVPSLGDYYGRVLERGELRLTFDDAAGTFAVAYFDGALPARTGFVRGNSRPRSRKTRGRGLAAAGSRGRVFRGVTRAGARTQTRTCGRSPRLGQSRRARGSLAHVRYRG